MSESETKTRRIELRDRRDRFAQVALLGLLMRPETDDVAPKHLAARAWAYADAMLTLEVTRL